MGHKLPALKGSFRYIDAVFPTMKSIKTGSEGNGESSEASEEAAAAPADPFAAPAEPIDFSKVEIEPLFKDFVDFETFSKSDFRAVKVLECEAVPKSKKLLKFVLDDGTDQNRVILAEFTPSMSRSSSSERR